MTASLRNSDPIAFQIIQCQRSECRFRYPVSVDSRASENCPKCHGLASTVAGPFSGRRLETDLNEVCGLNLEVFLDNIRSSHNVGSILRTCDGAGINHVHLCGITSTPEQAKVGKTALGADKTVPWTYHRNGVDAIWKLRSLGYCIWSLESAESSQPVFELDAREIPKRMILVVGNELSGVDPGLMALSDRVVSVPMNGVKSSLNVAVALGVAVYWLRYGIGRRVG